MKSRWPCSPRPLLSRLPPARRQRLSSVAAPTPPTANGSGVAAISVKKAGKYTVSATISGKTSASVEVNVTEAGENYTATVKNPHCGHPVSGRELDLHRSGADPHVRRLQQRRADTGRHDQRHQRGSYNASFTPKPGYQWSDGNHHSQDRGVEHCQGCWLSEPQSDFAVAGRRYAHWRCHRDPCR